ncbi:hypothetical protein [Streptomyces sp. NPDC055134]
MSFRTAQVHNLGDEFFERFLRYRDAVMARYPDVTVVSDSGPLANGPAR